MIPRSVAKVFTKYDYGSVPDEIEVRVAIPDIQTPEFSITDSWFTIPFRRYAMNIGLDGVLFIYYHRLHKGRFIGEMEGTVHWVGKET